MKKLLLSNLLLFLSIGVFAQPVLTSDEMLPYGSVLNYKFITDYSMIDVTSTGANVTWDYSTVTLDGSDDLNITMVNPSSTPYASSFPNSNYAYHETQGTDEDYRYFSLTSSKMERVGSYASSAKTYSDPQVEYVFPLTLNTTNNDTWDNDQSSFGGGTYDLNCIAYGTLKLPDATYNNVLLVKVSFDEGGFLDFDSYFWYDSDNGAVLFQYVQGDGFFVADQALYVSSLTVGTDPIILSSANAYYLKDLTYNNPVNNTLNVAFGNSSDFSGKYVIANTLGEKISEGTITGQQSLNLPCEELKQGMYLLTLFEEQNSDQKKTIRFVKQ
ncbi:MAG: hypothetical protein JWM14_3397 [Chitinophagaceae bacterium]|nr:hypothetical protein [Chitinophagaceae bacterium]